MREGDFELTMRILGQNKVVQVEMTVDEARNFPGMDDDVLEVALDEAQGEVFSGEGEQAFVVIRIVK